MILQQNIRTIVACSHINIKFIASVGLRRSKDTYFALFFSWNIIASKGFCFEKYLHRLAPNQGFAHLAAKSVREEAGEEGPQAESGEEQHLGQDRQVTSLGQQKKQHLGQDMQVTSLGQQQNYILARTGSSPR
jgi:hypothetical protein